MKVDCEIKSLRMNRFFKYIYIAIFNTCIDLGLLFIVTMYYMYVHSVKNEINIIYNISESYSMNILFNSDKLINIQITQLKRGKGGDGVFLILF